MQQRLCARVGSVVRPKVGGPRIDQLIPCALGSLFLHETRILLGCLLEIEQMGLKDMNFARLCPQDRVIGDDGLGVIWSKMLLNCAKQLQL